MARKLHRQYNIQNKNNQYICVVVGDTGTGKAGLSLILERYIKQGEVNLDTVCLTHEDFIEEYTSKPKEKVIVYEEGRFSFDKNKYSHSETKEARDKINQYRKFHHVIFLNFQNAQHLTSELVRNADAMIRIPKQGIAHYYNSESIQQMWRYGKFTGWVDYDARDFFPNPEVEIPEVWQMYEQQAEEELVSRDQEDDSSGLEDHFSAKEAASKLGLHRDTVKRYCKDKDGFKCRKVGEQDRL
ncbi:hypothetical protein GLU64_00730 [Nanohaloarchaea archaeon]|nr:hypothetical protein [Candidatus Nanohaloarchaea archaeon]